MAILYCSNCNFTKEISNQYIDKTTRCPQCKTRTKIWYTQKLIQAIISKYTHLHQQFKILKINQQKLSQTQQQQNDLEQKYQQLAEKHKKLQKDKGHIDQIIHDLKLENKQLNNKLKNTGSPQKSTKTTGSGSEIDYAFEGQDYAESLNNFSPIVEWFEKHHITLEPNKKASDISGYFDEIAVLLGDNLNMLYELLDGIRYRQRKSYTNFTLNLETYKPEKIKILKNFCKIAYQFTFFTRYHFNKKENKIFINLNDSPQIKSFFAGDWLEWYSFMKISSFLLTKNIPFSCVRSSKITFQKTGIKNELDNFFLVNNKTPLWIECKSGEFRDSINKYQTLRQRLNIAPKYAILLIAAEPDAATEALSSMFKLKIINEKQLLPYIETLF